jgi:hypothetical protein
MDSKTNKITKINPYYHPACVTHAHVAWATGLEAPATKNPTPRVTKEWGWKDGWFSETGLLAATEDQGESAEAE